MRPKSKINKKSSRITEKRGIKSGGKKMTKVKRNITTDTKGVNKRKVTRARRQKTLKTIRQKPQRRKTSLKKEIVVKRSSGRVEKFDTNRLAQTVSRSGVPFQWPEILQRK